LAEVGERLSDTRPVDPQRTVQAVFTVLSHHVPEGQIDKVRGTLPSPLRSFWEGIEEADSRPPEGGAGAAAETCEVSGEETPSAMWRRPRPRPR
jgi:hypothetical protein